tara:strand:- start:379 stop:546 length:168 start_codon:yes stop_codon:yes gene_type:complete
MNSIELENIESFLGTTEGKTMEDFFTELSIVLNIDTDTLKSEFKNKYSDEKNWSF